MAKIEVIHVSQVREGEYVCEEDDDRLLTSEAVNKNYDAGDQDWQHVIQALHKADVSKLTLAYHNGELHSTGWADGTLWREVNDDGTPTWHDPADRDAVSGRTY